MLVTFKSGACADVMMFGDVAKQLMDIVGKEFGAKGVITVEQMPQAIAQLKQALAEDRRLRQGEARGDDYDDERRERVSIGQRALPLIELLECSLREDRAVTWGV